MCVRMHAYVRTRVYVRTCVCACMHAYVRACMRMCVVYTCMRTCVYTCVLASATDLSHIGRCSAFHSYMLRTTALPSFPNGGTAPYTIRISTQATHLTRERLL